MSKLAQMLAEAAWTRGLTPEQRRRVDAETFSRVYPKGSHLLDALSKSAVGKILRTDLRVMQ